MEIEQEALALGWVPQEQFRGDAAKWVDAETFVNRGKEIMPILRKNNEKLLGEVESLKGTIGTMQTSLNAATEAMAEFKQYHEDTAKRAYQKAVADLKAQKVEALENGEHRKVVEIDDALRELDKEAPKAMQSGNKVAPPVQAQAPNPMQDPVFAQWESENRSWLVDPDKQAYANSIAQYLNATTKLRGREFLDKVKDEVEKRYTTASPQKVEGGATQSRSSGRNSYSDLPADAKAACDRMGAKLVGDNKAYKSMEEWRKQYAKDFFA